MTPSNRHRRRARTLAIARQDRFDPLYPAVLAALMAGSALAAAAILAALV